MELRAVYEVLIAAPRSLPLLIQTDSSYVINVFTQWISTWVRSGWRTSDRKAVANRQSIEMIATLLEDRDVQWQHVKGHAGHRDNELADRYAREAATCQKEGRPIRTGSTECLARWTGPDV